MKPLKGACIIGQSGGPTAVINASALGAIQTALQCEPVTRVLGAANGIEGVLKERLFDMAQEDPEELELLKYTPASALGSCRYKLADPAVDDTDYKRILEIFKKYDVRYFFYNGGNDSMDTIKKLAEYAARQHIDSGVIFRTKSGRPLDRANIFHDMKRLCDAAHVEQSKVFPHNLRHLFARAFYSVEKNLPHLADVLGHSSIETTRIYVAASSRQYERMLDKMKLIT